MENGELAINAKPYRAVSSFSCLSGNDKKGYEIHNPIDVSERVVNCNGKIRKVWSEFSESSSHEISFAWSSLSDMAGYIRTGKQKYIDGAKDCACCGRKNDIPSRCLTENYISEYAYQLLFVLDTIREGCIKHEIYAKISKLQALALEPISIQNDGGPTRPVFAEALKSQITSLQIDEQFFERLMNYSADPTVQRFLTTIVKTTSPQNAEDIIYRLTEDRMTQYDQAVSRFRYTSTCRQITEYLKRPILPSDGNLPDKDLYRDSISRDIEVFNIDSSFVEELRRNWENRTIRIFDNVACSISRDNVNAYANTIIDRKMKQYPAL